MNKFPRLLMGALLLPVVASCAHNDDAFTADTPVAATPVATPTPTPAPTPTAGAADAFPTLAAGTMLTMTARRGLEAFTITNGPAVDAGTALPTGTFAANPSGSYTKTATGFTLAIPSGIVTYVTSAGSANVIGTQTFRATATGGSNVIDTTLTNGAASTLTYATYGSWIESTASEVPVGFGTLVAGIATTTAQMPAAGSTATYRGNIQGAAVGLASGGNIASGTVLLNANFTGNTLTGTVTNVVTRPFDVVNGPAGTMNNINLTGGTISGAGFSGTAAAAAATGAPTVNITGASGTFGGSFFGPAATEALGSLALTGAGGIAVGGAFGTTKQ